jgi:hypothetical protein
LHQRVTIRAARAEDVDAILALWASARSEHAITPDRRVDLERLLARHADALNPGRDRSPGPAPNCPLRALRPWPCKTSARTALENAR